MNKVNSETFERPATPSDNVNWLYAAAVPTEVLHMRSAGKTPDGQILTGPGGQKTYRGRIAARDTDNSWRDNLSQLPDK